MYQSYSSSGPPSRTQRPKRERKVTAIFRAAADGQHAGRLTSLAVSEDGGHVFTSSRDFTVKRWATGGAAAPQMEATFEGHTDWVNDVSLLSSDTLVTASADMTVGLWRANSDGQMMFRLHEHSDHVTALAAAPACGLLATGGLSSQAFLWDINTGLKLQQEYQPWPAPGLKDSVYSLALSPDGGVLASGSPENCIRITDPRGEHKVMKLRGHTANVRALALNAAGTMCISGSSDHTMRVWDLGQQRCVSCFAVHEDSVWSLVADADFSVAVSGGRDGAIYRTNLSTRASELVCRGIGPVRRLAAAPDGRLWSASDGAGLTAWPGAAPAPVGAPLRSPRRPASGRGASPGGGGRGSPQPGRAAAGSPAGSHGSPAGRAAAGRTPQVPLRTPGHVKAVGAGAQAASKQGLGSASSRSRAQPDADSGHSFVAAASPAMRARQSTDGGGAPAALHERPQCAARPAAALRESAVLDDQRRVITRDADGNLALWDVTTGAVVKRLGQGKLAEAVREHFTPMSLSPWFTIEVNSGHLAVTLDPTQAATWAGEVYALDLGHVSARDDQRLAYAEQMTKGLFWKWAERSQQAGPDSRPELEPHRQSPPGGRSSFEFWEGRPVPVVASTFENSKPWRRLVTGFDGSEQPGEMVPNWVAECVWRNCVPAPPDDKCAFLLQPAPASELPQLAQARLNAPAIMRAEKVAKYVGPKLKEAGVEVLDPSPVLTTGRPQPAPRPPPGEQQLELTCASKAVPWDLTLAAVRKFIWQRSGDVVIEYRLADAANPAPVPVIEPPS